MPVVQYFCLRMLRVIFLLCTPLFSALSVLEHEARRAIFSSRHVCGVLKKALVHSGDFDSVHKVARIAVIGDGLQPKVVLKNAAKVLGGHTHIVGFRGMMQEPSCVDGVFLAGWRHTCLDQAYVRRATAFQMAWKRKIPILGVCFGMYVMVNDIFFRGQFVREMQPDGAFMAAQMPVGTSKNRYRALLHTKGSSHVGQTCHGFEQRFHHHFDPRPFVVEECVRQGFSITAYRSDGVVAAIEHAEHPFLVGTLFHPERGPRSSVHPLILNFMKTVFLIQKKRYLSWSSI